MGMRTCCISKQNLASRWDIVMVEVELTLAEYGSSEGSVHETLLTRAIIRGHNARLFVAEAQPRQVIHMPRLGGVIHSFMVTTRSPLAMFLMNLMEANFRGIGSRFNVI
ncbi:hypothetical protein AVEN_65898-1 [Araneus ventricosus]|uniref:Uncharacterized protein n=1 Tax=Araneus ventricosus TaxID=182803 RepID=A0A4Y2IYW2_ARAVE|nr:hypothetical protein AVEN_65898-1 [Araneus ventricosus]